MRPVNIPAGLDAVAWVTASQAKGEHLPGKTSAPYGEHQREVRLLPANEVNPEPIKWLWENWLAAGKLHILGGKPGTGKTTLAMSVAATVTSGGLWPDATRSITGNVVIWSGEDDPTDILAPRLSLAGAAMSCVYFVAGMREGNEERAFDPARDMESLRRKLSEIGDVKLLIIDPVVSAVTGDGNSNPQVRRSLQPLVDIGKEIGCAVIGITHLRKGSSESDPVERINGSIAYGALARLVWQVARRQRKGVDGSSVRLLCRAKSNLGPDDGGYEYNLQQAELKTHPGVFASSVLWGEAVLGTAQELLAAADATGEEGGGGTLAGAKRYLSDLLADGPLPTETIKADAFGAGYSWATIRRAKAELGIEAKKEGMNKGWVWGMSEQNAPKTLKSLEDAQQKEVNTFGQIEHLHGNPCQVEVGI